MPPKNISILGGGITGLSAAFHLSRKFPSSSITLLEKTDRLGGWIRSKRVEIDIPGGDEGNALLELGPRTLRPQSKALLELVNLLGLTQHLIVTPKNSAAAQNRFLYLPEARKPGLTAIPSSLLGYLTSPLSLITVPSVLREPFRRKNRPADAEDESLDSFMTRRFGSEFARVLGSSLVHGVYAADSRKLSVRAAFGPVWDAETRGNGSIIKGLYRSRGMKTPAEEYATGDLEQNMKDISVYSFRGGLETLTDALRQSLKAVSNVEIRTAVSVSKITPGENSIEITTSSGPHHSSHLVTTIPLSALDILIPGAELPHLTANPSSSVTVASFVFPISPTKIHPMGFGYLIPRSKGGYGSAANPLGVLGVVFDSCSLGAQDRPLGSLTKLTMMLGGPHPRFSADPSEMSAILLDTLQRQLGRSLPRPAHFNISYHENCIPTLKPGHLGRMEELKRALQNDPWHGKMEVIGAGVGGVSVGDCVEQGRQAGEAWK